MCLKDESSVNAIKRSIDTRYPADCDGREHEWVCEGNRIAYDDIWKVMLKCDDTSVEVGVFIFHELSLQACIWLINLASDRELSILAYEVKFTRRQFYCCPPSMAGSRMCRVIGVLVPCRICRPLTACPTIHLLHWHVQR